MIGSDVQKHHPQLQMLARHLQWSSFFNQLFIRVQLIYNVVLAPATQQSESAIHIHTATLFQTPFAYGSHRALNRIPCAIQYVLANYLFYICCCHCLVDKLFATPWTVACQAPLSMIFSRQEHWSGLPFPPPGELPNPGIKLMSLEYLALEG